MDVRRLDEDVWVLKEEIQDLVALSTAKATVLSPRNGKINILGYKKEANLIRVGSRLGGIHDVLGDSGGLKNDEDQAKVSKRGQS